MATINNQDLKKELIAGAKIQLSVDKVPARLAESVVPTMEVNPEMIRKLNVHKFYNKTNTGTFTIYTTPTDADFYLVSSGLNGTLNATNDGVSSSIQATDEFGNTILVHRINFEPLTALSNLDERMDLPKPIKLKRGSTITIGSVYTAGAQYWTGTIYGYFVAD